ncbi:MAG: membrane protease subunit HflK [Verrucomicrobiales bacterium]|jgi:membrane protease subunit HflK
MQSLNPKIIIAAIIGFLVLACLSTAFYTVPAEAVGVVTRFGKMNPEYSQPGLHFKMPFGIDEVDLVSVKRQQKQEFGFGTSGATNQYQYSLGAGAQNDEKSMITGDRNEATVEWVIQYRIDRPDDYLFRVRNPDATLRDVSESVMREVVGDRTVDEVLTVGRQQIETAALEKMQTLANRYKLGLRIDQVQLKNVNPPPKVQQSFNEVNKAQQEKEQSINEAWKENNKEVPRAKGLADQEISQAEGYAAERVNEAEGDAGKFIAVFEAFQKAPEVTKRRMYLETLAEVVPKLGSKIIMDEDAKQVLPLLQLSNQKN